MRIDELDATAMAELVRKKEVTALELVDAAVARIEAAEPVVGALASHDFERARDAAKVPRDGPFAGVPFLLKDLLAYPGLRHTFGSRAMRDNVAAQGSPYTDAFDRAGLIVLGKTKTSELGLLGSTETLLDGPVHNPWNLARSAMGSSGGSAAAVAANLVPMAHASDGGGSIRIPASGCGLFGLKPSRGRILPTGMEAGDLLAIIVEHCVSRTVRDSALLLFATQGETLPPLPLVHEPSRARLRIGYYDRTSHGEKASPEVQRVFESTVALCRELGHELVDAGAPPLDGAAISEAFFGASGAALTGFKGMIEGLVGRTLGAEDLEPFTLELIAWYAEQPPGLLERALSAVARASADFRAHLAEYDVLLCPTMPDVAPPLGALSPSMAREEIVRRTERLAGFTAPPSIAGVPAMSVPSGLGDEAMPIGMQFSAASGREDLLLALAYELEAARPFPRPPAV